jgi:hypothetical protein
VKSLFTQYISLALTLATLTMGALLLSACGSNINEVANLPSTIIDTSKFTVVPSLYNYSGLSRSCTTSTVTAALTASSSGTPATLQTNPFTSLGGGACSFSNEPQNRLFPTACTVQDRATGVVTAGDFRYAISDPSCNYALIGTPINPITANVVYNFGLTTPPQQVQGLAGSIQQVSVRIPPIFTSSGGTVPGTNGTVSYTINSAMNNAVCETSITFPAAPDTCNVVQSTIPLNLIVVNSDLPTSLVTIAVDAVADNGDRESLNLQRQLDGSYQLPINYRVVRDAAPVIPNNNAFDIVEPPLGSTTSSPTVGIRLSYNSVSSQGVSTPHTATFTLAP